MTPFPCPYVFPDSRRCPGHLVKIEAFNADLSWVLGESGGWVFNHAQPRSRYQLFCSERSGHAADSLPEQMKCYLSGMPDGLLAVVTALTRGSIPTEPELPVGEARPDATSGTSGSAT